MRTKSGYIIFCGDNREVWIIPFSLSLSPPSPPLSLLSLPLPPSLSIITRMMQTLRAYHPKWTFAELNKELASMWRRLSAEKKEVMNISIGPPHSTLCDTTFQFQDNSMYYIIQLAFAIE
jgi:hypothetical protein